MFKLFVCCGKIEIGYYSSPIENNILNLGFVDVFRIRDFHYFYVLDLLVYSHINNATFNINTNTYNYKYINKTSSKNSSNSIIESSNETSKTEEVETTTTNMTTEGKLLPSNAANKEYNVSTVNATSLPKTGEDVPVMPFVIGSLVLLAGASLLLKKV